MQCVFRCQLQHPFQLFSAVPVPVAKASTQLQGTLRLQQQCSLTTAKRYTLTSKPRSTSSQQQQQQQPQSGTRQLSLFFSGNPFRGSHCATAKAGASIRQEQQPCPPSLWSGCSSLSRGSPRKGGSRCGPSSDPHSGPVSWTVRNGNSLQRPFNPRNPGSTAVQSTLLFGHARPHPQPREHSQSLSRYHTSSSPWSSSSSSSSSSSPPTSAIDALQTWRRPNLRSRPLLPAPSGSESRSLATMPSKPVMAVKGSISDPATRLQRSLTAVPHHNIKNEIKLRCTEFDHKGNVKTTAGEFLKSDLCQQHGLHARDLRKIDSSFNNQMPVLLVRPEAILVNVGHIRALIKADLVVLFDSFGSTDSYNQSIFIYDLEEKLRMSTSAAGGLPFEFRALEAIFISVLSSLQSEMEVLVHFVTNLLAHLEESIDQNKLKELLQYSKKLSQFESKTLLIRDVFVEVLDQDDDLANMYLTDKKLGHPRTTESHEEIEILLESYLKQVEEIANTVSIVKQQMQSTEEIVNVILGANRNQLLLFELRIAMGTLGMSSGAIIASLYGMNLHNYLETNPHAFAIVGSTALGISMMVFAFCSRKLKQLAKGTT